MMRAVARACLLELEKLAEGWDTPEEVHRLLDSLGVEWDDNPNFMRFCQQLTGTKKLDNMSPKQLMLVARVIADKHGKKGEKAAREATPSRLPPLPKLIKANDARSDIVRAASRKKMLLGVRREKAILKMDIMRRIRKKLRLANRPFLGLKQKQRQVRLGLVRGARDMARQGYRRR